MTSNPLSKLEAEQQAIDEANEAFHKDWDDTSLYQDLDEAEKW